MKTIIGSICIDGEREKSNQYFKRSKILIDSVLKHTNFSILMLTDKPDKFNYNNERVFIRDFNELYPDEPKEVYGTFNFNLKRYPIKLCSELNFNYIFYNDCDCFYSGWHNESYLKMLEEDFDVYYATFYPHHTVRVQIDNPKDHPNTGRRVNSVKEAVTEEMLDAVLGVETRMLYKNNDKLKVMLDKWDEISRLCEKADECTHPESTFFCMAGQHAKMKATGVSRQIEIANYCNMIHGVASEKEQQGVDKPLKILNYFGLVIDRKDTEDEIISMLGI